MKHQINTQDGTLVMHVDTRNGEKFPVIKLIPVNLPFPITLRMTPEECGLVSQAFELVAEECAA